MCAIVDADCTGEIVAASLSPAAQAFRESIMNGSCRLVVGGSRLRQEYGQSSTKRGQAKQTTVSKWMSEFHRAGKLVFHNDGEVDDYAKEIQCSGMCMSEDYHIIALARVTGARLLYSRDQNLHRDFKNQMLLNNPPGKVYPREFNLVKSQSWLSRNRKLCS